MGSVTLNGGGIYSAASEKASGEEEIERYAKGIDRRHRPEHQRVAENLGQNTTQQHTQAHTYIPRDENRRVGRAPLRVPRHRNHHVLKSRPHVAVAQADQDGTTVITDEG